MITAKTGLYKGKNEMKKVSLLFGIHMHQPVDNFDSAVEKAVTDAYLPFFQTMARYSAFKFSLHCSGWLLEKIRVEYTELFTLMQELTQKGSIEWLSGGYYEPVLSSISSRDRRAQIEKLSTYIFTYFKQEPKGLWLTERVWEASLLHDIKACGLEYVMVDDYHFLSNGFCSDSFDGYHTTEDATENLALFPIAKDLRYALPFSEVEVAVEKILVHNRGENPAAVIFDDAEKFGLWPQTNEWVYGQKWLQKFVEAVLKHPMILTQHYSSYKKQNRSLGLVYLDNCSYEEMGEWSLKLPKARALQQLKKQTETYTLKGGIWKNFFIKYHESNYLHKRMLKLSEEQENFDADMLESLYKLQTNDVFWHGVFGGLYLPSLRDNAYHYLLAIEAKQKVKKTSYRVVDINKDGYDEFQVKTAALSCVISAKNGAQLIEFGSLTARFNWQNTLMRREEIYHHEEPAKEQNQNVITTIHNQNVILDDTFQKYLVFDWHAKNSFIEHFAQEAFTLQNFQQLTFRELGDFANQPFVLEDKKFQRKGGLYCDGKSYKASLQKKYKFASNKISLKSKFITEYTLPLYFAQEFNLHFAHPKYVTFNGKTVGEGWSAYDIDTLTIFDDFTEKKLVIKTSQICDVFAYIMHTVSKSENGFERIAQQISFIFTRSFEQSLNFKISLEVQDV